jgi:hypothetical protein
LPDCRDNGFLPVIPLGKGQFKVDGCCVCEIAKPCFTRKKVTLGSVRLSDERLFHFYRAQFHPYGFVALATYLNVSLDDPLLVYDFLKIMQYEIVEGVKLVAGNMLP